MATNAAEILEASSATGAIGRFIDRWIFVFMAALFIAVTLLGFVPASIDYIGLVKAHVRPPIPVVFHFHAVLMGSWLLLLLTQGTLVAVGRTALHRQLGVVSVLLLPAIVVAGVLIVQAQWRELQGNILAPHGFAPAQIAVFKGTIVKLLVLQTRMLIVFPALVVWALLLRAKDSQAHKRLMILATVIPLGAGLGRALDFLGAPENFGPPFFYLDLYSVVILLPLLIYDVVRQRPVQRAYIIWGACFVSSAVAMYLVAGSSWWALVAPRLMGMRGWS